MESKVVFDSKDIEIEEDIYGAIRDKGGVIHVVVNNGAVHLSGDADDIQAKRSVGSAIQNIPGVRYVINHIRVLSKLQIRFPWNESDPEAESFRSLLRKRNSDHQVFR
jgi:hypothetical protein